VDYRAIINAETLAAFRQQEGLSSAELARLLGVNPATLTRWEQGGGRRGPEGPAALLMAAMLIRSGCAQVSPVVASTVVGRAKTILEGVGAILND
jgi:transcriptional regulator with XRE-family HTH domain